MFFDGIEQGYSDSFYVDEWIEDTLKKGTGMQQRLRFGSYLQIFKGACSHPQPHPPNLFQTYGDFGTRS